MTNDDKKPPPQKISAQTLKEHMKKKPEKRHTPGELHDIREFQFVGPKKEGVEVGVIAQKKGHFKKEKIADNQSGKKYNYKWMVKNQPYRDTIADIIGAETARFFLGDAAPKDRLVQGKSINGNPEIYIASRFIENFTNLGNAMQKQGKAKDPMHKQYEHFYKTVPNAYKAMAVNLLIGNYDFHFENIGIVKDKDVVQVAPIDFGRALNFFKPTDPDKQDIIFALSSKGVVHPATQEIKAGTAFTPTDILRLVHGNHYKINSPIFLNAECIAEMHEIINKMDSEGYKLDHILRSAAHQVTKNFSDREIENIGMQLAPGTNKDNFANNLVNAFHDRREMMRDLVVNMEVQLSLAENNNKKFEELLDKHPDLLDKSIKWLALNHEYSYHPSSTLDQYLWVHKHTEARAIFTEKKDELKKSVTNKLNKLDPNIINSQEFKNEIIALIDNPTNQDRLPRVFANESYVSDKLSLKSYLTSVTGNNYEKLVRNIGSVYPSQINRVCERVETELSTKHSNYSQDKTAPVHTLNTTNESTADKLPPKMLKKMAHEEEKHKQRVTNKTAQSAVQQQPTPQPDYSPTEPEKINDRNNHIQPKMLKKLAREEEKYKQRVNKSGKEPLDRKTEHSIKKPSENIKPPHSNAAIIPKSPAPQHQTNNKTQQPNVKKAKGWAINRLLKRLLNKFLNPTKKKKNYNISTPENEQMRRPLNSSLRNEINKVRETVNKTQNKQNMQDTNKQKSHKVKTGRAR